MTVRENSTALVAVLMFALVPGACRKAASAPRRMPELDTPLLLSAGPLTDVDNPWNWPRVKTADDRARAL